MSIRWPTSLSFTHIWIVQSLRFPEIPYTPAFWAFRLICSWFDHLKTGIMGRITRYDIFCLVYEMVVQVVPENNVPESTVAHVRSLPNSMCLRLEKLTESSSHLGWLLRVLCSQTVRLPESFTSGTVELGLISPNPVGPPRLRRQRVKTQSLDPVARTWEPIRQEYVFRMQHVQNIMSSEQHTDENVPVKFPQEFSSFWEISNSDENGTSSWGSPSKGRLFYVGSIFDFPRI